MGAFIIPVQEGFLWLPYDEAAKHEGEVLLIQDARLMAADDCEVLSDDVQSYTNGLVDALGDIKVHLHSQHVTCFERQADLSFAGYLLNSGCTCPDCREQRLKRYHVTFSRKGSAMVMAANEEEARRIADATIHEDEVSWDDDWSAEYAELDKDNLD